MNLSINEIAKTINKTFDSSDKNSIWDLFLINYETNSPKCIQPIVDSSEFYSVSSKKSETNEIINNMMILLLNYQGKALSLNEEESKLEKKETFKTKSMNKSMDKSEKVTSAFRNMKDEKFQNRLDSVNNILKKLESTYFRDKFEREEDRIKGTSNLPFSYVVEMIKDINDVLRLYKENLMVNVTRALYKLKN